MPTACSLCPLSTGAAKLQIEVGKGSSFVPCNHTDLTDLIGLLPFRRWTGVSPSRFSMAPPRCTLEDTTCLCLPLPLPCRRCLLPGSRQRPRTASTRSPGQYFWLCCSEHVDQPPYKDKQPLQTEELVTDGLRLRLKSVQVVERKTTGALKDVVAKARQSKVAPKDQRPGRRRRKQ